MDKEVAALFTDGKGNIELKELKKPNLVMGGNSKGGLECLPDKRR